MPRRNFQHYIPRFILKNFSDDGCHIWTYSHKDGVQNRRIDSMFGQKHLYSKKTVDRTNRASISPKIDMFEQSVRKDPVPYERNEIGKLESDAAPIVQHLIEQVRRDRLPPIEHFSEITTLQQFLYLSARRTPESHIRVWADWYREADHSAFQQIRDSVPNSPDYSFNTPEELYFRFPIAKRIRDIERENARARFAAGIDRQDDIRNFCANNDLLILHCKNTRRRFIIGSFGYAIVITNSSHRFGKTAVFPIAYDMAIRFEESQGRFGIGPILSRKVHQTNIAMAELSHTIAGHSKALVLQYKDHVRSWDHPDGTHLS